MRDGFIGPLIAFVVSAFITFALLLIGFILWFRTKRFVDHALRANGVVIGNTITSSEGQGLYSPVVRFTAVDGSVVEFTEIVASYPPEYKGGDPIHVLYRRDNFQKARGFRKLSSLYWPAMIFGGIGGVFVLVMCLLGGVFAIFYFVLEPLG
jgi:hypothetical protein